MLKHADATCHRILVGGKSDTTYNKGSVNTTANFFLELVPDSNVYFETKIDSPHLVPGIDPYLCWWEEWGGPDNCTDAEGVFPCLKTRLLYHLENAINFPFYADGRNPV